MSGFINHAAGATLQKDVVCKKSEGLAKRLNTQHLAGSQVVVCKIRQPPFLVPQALLSAIPFHLLGVVLAIFLPIVRVRLAPLPRTLQANLLIHRIGSDLLPMIIGAALALACRLVANLLLRMITVRLKRLADSNGNGDPSSGGSEGEWKRFILSGSAVTTQEQPVNGCWLFLAASLDGGRDVRVERRVRALQRLYDYAV